MGLKIRGEGSATKKGHQANAALEFQDVERGSIEEGAIKRTLQARLGQDSGDPETFWGSRVFATMRRAPSSASVHHHKRS